MSGGSGVSPQAVHGLLDADREVALLLDIIAATSTGPGVEPMAAAVARACSRRRSPMYSRAAVIRSSRVGK